MTNALGIAAVTSSIRWVLERALQVPHPGPVGGAIVTTLRPDRLTDTDLVSSPGINVYCYEVRPNHASNLSDLPTRRPDGSITQRPTTALDLHYLITCYGEDDSLDSQRLLGRAALALAVNPVLTGEVITSAVTAYQDDDPTSFLDEVDLANQVDRVTVAPRTLSTEEISRLWTMLATPYQLSLTYTASALLLEADVAPRTVLPVRERSLTVNASGRPLLVEVDGGAADRSAQVGSTLVLRGTGLLGPSGTTTVVRVGGVDVAPDPGATSTELRAVLPAAVRGGIAGVQVVHIEPSDGTEPARVAGSSGVLPLVVRPVVTPSVTATEVSLAVDPPLRPLQRASVVLTGLTASGTSPTDMLTFRFDPVPAGGPDQATLTIPTGEVPAGDWLVRVSVDGVDSLPSLVGETFGSPAVTIP